jgi:hypothetical protein
LYLVPLVAAMLLIALWPAAIVGSTKQSVDRAISAAASESPSDSGDFPIALRAVEPTPVAP